MLKFFSALLFGLLTVAASAQGNGGGSIDKFFFNTSLLLTPPNLDNNPLSQTATQTIDTTKTNLILIVAGQSNIASPAPTAFTPVNGSSLFQLSIFDGKIYPALDPLLATNRVLISGTAELGSPALRVADSIVTNAYFQRVYVVSFAVSGTSVADWSTGAENPLLALAVLRIKSKGIVCGGTNTTCVIIWGQGETDNTNGTSQGTYTSSLNTVISNTSAAGFVGHWYVAKQTYNGANSTAIQNAQAAVVNNTSVFAGPNADSLVGNLCGVSNNAACRNGVDTVHWTDNGSLSYAALWVTALHTGGF